MPPLSNWKLMAFRRSPKQLSLRMRRPEIGEDATGAKTLSRAGLEVNAIARRPSDPDDGGTVLHISTEVLTRIMLTFAKRTANRSWIGRGTLTVSGGASGRRSWSVMSDTAILG